MKRNRYMQIRLSQEEFEAIERKFQNSGLRSRSEFIRTMIFEGIIVRISEDELKEIHRLVNNIAGNVNQIAVRVNSTGNIYAEDISEIKEGLQKIWQPLRYFQLQLQKLKR
ncbi:MAG: plasmid mobilization relaxosome protein MobC [Ruminococcus sp.]|nr:plasmid mobilization relaxosome protein MobC [Ruminococcus sp.]